MNDLINKIINNSINNMYTYVTLIYLVPNIVNQIIESAENSNNTKAKQTPNTA